MFEFRSCKLNNSGALNKVLGATNTRAAITNTTNTTNATTIDIALKSVSIFVLFTFYQTQEQSAL